jgi:aspartyl/asparaginyl beta-hydroxylase (cupin superfamily)
MGLLNTLYKLYDNACIFEYKKLDIHKLLQKNHDKLLNEFNENYSKYKLINPGIFSNEFHEPNKKYGYFNIKYYGNVNEDKFPVLTKLVDDDDIYTCFYSVIKGKKNIPEHRGPYSGILRYHYTLFSSNDDKDYLKLFWREKDGFLFDDTYFHEAQKKSSGIRVALIIDIKRKLPFILDRVNALFLKYISNTEYVKSCRRELNLILKKKIKLYNK